MFEIIDTPTDMYLYYHIHVQWPYWQNKHLIAPLKCAVLSLSWDQSIAMPYGLHYLESATRPLLSVSVSHADDADGWNTFQIC